MPHDGSASILDISRGTRPSFEAQPKIRTHEEIQASSAQTAVEQILKWLSDTRNNSSYLTSDTYLVPKRWLEEHQQEIVQVIESDIPTPDVWRTLKLVSRQRYGQETETQPDNEEEIDLSGPKIFSAYEVAYDGIKSIVDEMKLDNETSQLEDINRHAVRAIGATLVRLAHFDYLSKLYPLDFAKDEHSQYDRLFKQNVVAAVFTAARLANNTERIPSAQSPARLDAEPVEAAA